MDVRPRLLLIDEEVLGSEMAGKILAKFPDVPQIVLPAEGTGADRFPEVDIPGKSIFHLAKDEGELLKRCPGTQNYLCCGYWVIHPVENCAMECTYCILQHYLTRQEIRIHVETERLFSRIHDFLTGSPRRLFRIGSGELSDSLLFDPVTEYSSQIAEFLKPYHNVLFEFKTKSARIERLLAFEGRIDHIVVGWTLNTPEIIRSEEFKTASLEERLDCARACREKGFKLSFHFDPIIAYPGCAEEYCRVVDALFSKVRPQDIAWISMGMLRYPPNLKGIIARKFPKSKIVYGETVCGNDGKVRYYKKIRVETMRAVYRRIRSYAGDSVFVYMCMEHPGVWERVFGFRPESNEEFEVLFERKLREKYGLPD